MLAALGVIALVLAVIVIVIALGVGGVAGAVNAAQLVSVPLAAAPLIVALIKWLRQGSSPAADQQTPRGDAPDHASPPKRRSAVYWAVAGIIAVIAASVWIVGFPDGRRQFPGDINGAPTSTAQPGAISAPTTTKPPAPQPVLVQVRIDMPSEGTLITAGQNVQLAGSVTDLGADTLWIISKPDMGDGLYYLTARGPVADHDGNWRFLDEQVGDASDRNHNIVYKAVQADRRCSQELARVGPDENSSYTFQTLPETCKIRAERTVAVK